MQDYGGPIGFRMALAHSDRIEALILQDAVAHNEGLGRIGSRGGPSGRSRLRTKLRFAQICCRWRRRRTRHVGNDPNVERYDPDL